MKKIKYIISVIVILSIIILIESLLQMTNLPVTVLDLSFTPICLALTYYLLRTIIKNKKTNNHYLNVDSISTLKKYRLTNYVPIHGDTWIMVSMGRNT